LALFPRLNNDIIRTGIKIDGDSSYDFTHFQAKLFSLTKSRPLKNLWIFASFTPGLCDLMNPHQLIPSPIKQTITISYLNACII
jgi:hypothetical protein